MLVTEAAPINYYIEFLYPFLTWTLLQFCLHLSFQFTEESYHQNVAKHVQLELKKKTSKHSKKSLIWLLFFFPGFICSYRATKA